ncbi:GSCFA domain-containing protein [Kocuria sp. p3-SID1433]|uniref:GSCFA domain-containing protein n=1 Tax=unclassified Kocuria TaxID=2649579 RepID=UPI0021A38DA6|nr:MULTISPECIES: GSCFA domain-containing protein [unclassified Kocuria]MCT1601377.1 GSCFA domain-containing protein [Kocuria sp. p3-SID1428]MCT2180045.1 GSCFA domain-containing protein [Kocuria sp. p3-SID1433]
MEIDMPAHSPYRGRPESALWKTAVSGRHPEHLKEVVETAPQITTSTKIMTAGSCFAQHIATRLKSSGFTVLDHEPAPAGTSREWQLQHGFGTYSARYGNIYFVRQLLQLLQEAEGVFTPQDWIWKSGSRYYDALRPSVETAGHPTADSVRQHRAEHLSAVRRLVRDADLFVFTLGTAARRGDI